MTIRSLIKATLLATCAVMPVIIWSCLPNTAAGPLGVKVWEVNQFRLDVAKVHHKRVGVYGDMRLEPFMRPYDPITIRDRVHPESFIHVDLRRLNDMDTLFVHSFCNYGSTCSLAITGVFRRGQLRAEHVYFSLNGNYTTLDTPNILPIGTTNIPKLRSDPSGTAGSNPCKGCSNVPKDVCPSCYLSCGDYGCDDNSGLGWYL